MTDDFNERLDLILLQAVLADEQRTLTERLTTAIKQLEVIRVNLEALLATLVLDNAKNDRDASRRKRHTES